MTRSWFADHILEESSRHSWGAPPVTPVPRKPKAPQPSTKQDDSRPVWQRYTGGLTPKARGEQKPLAENDHAG